jgi:hypothetical protein
MSSTVIDLHIASAAGLFRQMRGQQMFLLYFSTKRLVGLCQSACHVFIKKLEGVFGFLGRGGCLIRKGFTCFFVDYGTIFLIIIDNTPGAQIEEGFLCLVQNVVLKMYDQF